MTGQTTALKKYLHNSGLESAGDFLTNAVEMLVQMLVELEAEEHIGAGVPGSFATSLSEGVSTRKVDALARSLGLSGIDKSRVSRICNSHKRPCQFAHDSAQVISTKIVQV